MQELQTQWQGIEASDAYSTATPDEQQSIQRSFNRANLASFRQEAINTATQVREATNIEYDTQAYRMARNTKFSAPSTPADWAKSAGRAIESLIPNSIAALGDAGLLMSKYSPFSAPINPDDRTATTSPFAREGKVFKAVGEKAKEFSREYDYVIPEPETEDFGTMLGSGAGSVAKYIGLSLTGVGLSGIFTDIYGATLMESEDMFPEWTDDQRSAYAGVVAYPQALLTRWGATQLIGEYGRMTVRQALLTSKLGMAAKAGLRSSAKEGVEEATQNMWKNLVDITVGVEDRKLLDGVVESMVVAAIVSFPIGGAGGLTSHTRATVEQRTAMRDAGLTDADITKVENMVREKLLQEIDANPESIQEAIGILQQAELQTAEISTELGAKLLELGLTDAQAIEYISNTDNGDHIDMLNKINKAELEADMPVYQQKFDTWKQQLPTFMDAETAEANATMVDAMIRTSAQKWNMLPSEVANDILPTITSQTLEGGLKQDSLIKKVKYPDKYDIFEKFDYFEEINKFLINNYEGELGDVSLGGSGRSIYISTNNFYKRYELGKAGAIRFSDHSSIHNNDIARFSDKTFNDLLNRGLLFKFQERVNSLFEAEMDKYVKASGATSDWDIEIARQDFVGDVLEYGQTLENDISNIIDDLLNQAQTLKQDTRGMTARIDGTNFVSLLNADKSTFMHEMSHIFLSGYLKNAPDQLGDVYKWAKVDNKPISQLTEAEYILLQERFANGFEQYLAEGKAPNAEMRTVFEQVREWMLEIYKSVAGVMQSSNIGIELNSEIRAFYDSMFNFDQSAVKIDPNMTGEVETKGVTLYQKMQQGIQELKDKFNEIMANYENKQANIKDTVKRITKFIETSPLSQELKNEFLEKVSKAKTRKQISEIKKEIPFKAEREIKELTKMEIKNKVKKILKKTKATKVGGKIQGKYTPEIQRSLDLMREASKMTVIEAQSKIVANIEAIGDNIPTIEQSKENSILLFMAGFTETSLEDASSILETVETLVNEGRYINKLKHLTRETAINEMKEDVLKVLTGGKNIDRGRLSLTGVEGYSQKNILSEADKAMRSLGKTIVGYKDLLDMLSSLDKTSKVGESELNKIAEVLTEKNAEKKGIRESNEKLRDISYKVYNFKNDSELIEKFNNDKRPVEIEVTLKDGSKETLEMSIAEARKRYMEFKDPTLNDTFEEMGYTPKIKKQITDLLSKKDIAFADAQMQFYQDYYNGVNEVYRDMFGVDLPQNSFYSPIAREGIGKQENINNEFLNEIAFQRASVGGGAIKSRVVNKHRLKQLDDVATIERHIIDMEHFKAWARKSRDLRAIFNDPIILDAASIYHDPNLMALTRGHIEAMIANGKDTRHAIEWLDTLRVRSIKAVLPFKLSITTKQVTSMPAYANAIPINEWTARSAKFWADPLNNTRELYENSELLKSRGQTMERDIQASARAKKYKAYVKSASLMEKGMMNVQFGDQFAIVAGGWAVYDYYKSQGLSTKKAIEKFEEVTESTQQSGDISEQSYWQRGGSIAKALTMYQSSINQYFRKELEVVRGLYSGRMDTGQAAKQIAIFHFMLPMIFQYVSSGFKWEEDEQKRAAVLGTLNGLFIAGPALEKLYNKINGLWVWDSGSTPALAVLEKISKLGRNNSTLYDKYKVAGESLGLLSGLAVSQLVNFTEALNKITDGELSDGLWQLYTLTGSKRR